MFEGWNAGYKHAAHVADEHHPYGKYDDMHRER
jgi:hypothetical protein